MAKSTSYGEQIYASLKKIVSGKNLEVKHIQNSNFTIVKFEERGQSLKTYEIILKVNNINKRIDVEVKGTIRFLKLVDVLDRINNLNMGAIEPIWFCYNSIDREVILKTILDADGNIDNVIDKVIDLINFADMQITKIDVKA